MCYASSLEHFVVVWSIPSLPSLLPPSLPPSCPLPSSPSAPPVSLPLPSPRLPHTLQAHTPAELGPATPKGSHARVPSDAAHRLCSACRQTPRTQTALLDVPSNAPHPNGSARRAVKRPAPKRLCSACLKRHCNPHARPLTSGAGRS